MTAHKLMAIPNPEDEVVEICQSLLRIDTTNLGNNCGPGERIAAEYIMDSLIEVGLYPTLYEKTPGRSNVVLRLKGSDRVRPGLVVHGHLDVVPAEPGLWQVPPFSGLELDGCLWGRGAVDMKNMVAMMVANLRWLARTRTRPQRDLVFAFFADEEAGGEHGAGWLVESHPELFADCSEAVSEVGGFSVSIKNARTDVAGRSYLIQTAEKGVLWLRLQFKGVAGHGSLGHTENAVVRLCEAISRIEAHNWPNEFIGSVKQLLSGVAAIAETPVDFERLEPLLRKLGGARTFIESSLRDVVNPTIINAGYKHNVVPSGATAYLDCRFLPGHEQKMLTTITDLAGPYCDIEIIHRGAALEVPHVSPLFESMKRALEIEDPGAHVLPYCLSAGTDNKHLSQLGIKGYGFVPLRLPADFDFVSMFHGVDERIPVVSLRFGARVLREFLISC